MTWTHLVAIFLIVLSLEVFVLFSTGAFQYNKELAYVSVIGVFVISLVSIFLLRFLSRRTLFTVEFEKKGISFKKVGEKGKIEEFISFEDISKLLLVHAERRVFIRRRWRTYDRGNGILILLKNGNVRIIYAHYYVETEIKQDLLLKQITTFCQEEYGISVIKSEIKCEFDAGRLGTFFVEPPTF